MDAAETDPVSIVVTWDVKPGRERDFEEWAEALHQAAIRYPGHRGATWLRAEGMRNRYYTVVGFSDQERLDRWLGSGERADLIDRVRGIAEEHQQDTTGLETWFSVPGESVPAPSKPKMMAVTFCAVYPISLALNAFLTPLTKAWPVPVQALVFPLLVVPVLTLLVMPALSRLLRRWLYPVGRVHRPARPGR
ncbi:antibiotic biosynthesis monooxygenase [Actinomadura sp. KC345]|uniref:antibiotic biosynthesis monooxygenase n=1 Tax=Actinomadura sp. KC345 TaxID=2530371 RepID=UPI0010478396|nr:antibiotic biosynthesis monooxygenase [Actinomadura sp. KC345]TDC49360.1 antibiotic biosynthesis monooxygenase [Actinomadura sp. KC345]